MEVNTLNLSVGKRFKNLQQLSLEVLGEKLPNGKGRQLRIEQMKQYFSWKKVKNSQAVIITEVYINRKKPISRQCKYVSFIFNILASYPNELCFTKHELLHVLGIVNDKFDPKKFVSNANTLDLTYKLFKKINTDIYNLLFRIVLNNLRLLDSYGYIKLTEDKKIIYKDPSIQEVSPSVIDEIYQKCLVKFDCPNFYEVISKGLLKDFNKLCNDEFDSLNIKRVYNIYKISILTPPLDPPDQNALRNLCKDFLIKHYKSDSLACKVINYYMD